MTWYGLLVGILPSTNRDLTCILQELDEVASMLMLGSTSLGFFAETTLLLLLRKQ